jgi:hypothetical protein
MSDPGSGSQGSPAAGPHPGRARPGIGILEELLGDVVYVADIRIERIKGPYRHAWLPAHEGPVEFGVHGAVKEHYGAQPDREITTTLDYVMAATGG